MNDLIEQLADDDQILELFIQGEDIDDLKRLIRYVIEGYVCLKPEEPRRDVVNNFNHLKVVR